jgi:hypothetical protein
LRSGLEQNDFEFGTLVNTMNRAIDYSLENKSQLDSIKVVIRNFMESDIDYIVDGSGGLDKVRTEVGCERDGRAGNLIMPVANAGSSDGGTGLMGKCSYV